ncbi:MAG TPA: glycoside hydrolase family 3 C-terminal domain-containing protein [bacterium]|nr:glycoside hydrolase family 3 C-terminal domain-containing protein [bacterium]
MAGGRQGGRYPRHAVSPYEGLTRLLGDSIKVEFSEGVHIGTFQSVRIPLETIKTPDAKSNGFWGEYFNNQKLQGQPIFTRVDDNIDFDYKTAGPDPRLGIDHFSIRWTAKFTAPETRKYDFSLSSDDGSVLYINDQLMIDNWQDHGERAMTCQISMEAGKTYDMKIEFYENSGDAVIRLGWKDPADDAPEASIEQAVEAARKAGAVIVCVGNIDENESEGSDVSDFKMFGGQDELVQAIAKANPNTVVVVYGGVPILMKHWLGSVKAVIAAMYPGQEGGTALADILFGRVNPSGKLPFSYIQDRSESPVFKEYKDPGLKVHYSEGVFVGYRYYDKNNIDPLFPFGYGLSYTTFEYSNLKIVPTAGLDYQVSLDVKNTGLTAGQEVVQLYVSPKTCSFQRPLKELKGFVKVDLASGQTKTVTIRLDRRVFQFYHPDKKQWITESGDFEILLGSSSRDIKLNGLIKM